jgi:general secretion pathway protein C
MLDLFFRKYAWTANLAVLLVAAWLGAKAVNTLVGAVIRPRPQAELSAPVPTAARPSLPATLDPEKLYRLIGVAPPAEQAEEAAPRRGPQNCGDAAARPVKTGLRLQLVAGVLAERPQWSLATVTDLGTRENRILGVGDEIQGARMLSVERVRDERDATGNGFKVVAVLCNAGTKEYVDAEPGPGAPADTAPSLGVASLPRPPVPGAPPAPAEGVTKVGDHSYQIARTTIDQALTNMNTLATQARIVPSFKNGVANGFKLFSIQPGSLYASIGIENGDVIQRINGYEINSPDKALEVYQRLRESSHVTIELERAGQVVRKEYNVTGQ